MFDRSKVLGMALAMMVVAAGVAAPAAVAHDFHYETQTTLLTGTADEEAPFNINFNRELTCDGAKLAATTVSVTTDVLTADPELGTGDLCTYEGAPIYIPVITTGCNFVLDSDTTKSEELEGEHGTLQIECEPTKSITIELPGCKLGIVPQIVHGLSYENHGKGSTRDFTVAFTTETLVFTTLGGSCFSYGYISGGTGTNMTFEGAFTVRAYEDKGGEEGKQVGTWVE